MRLIPYSLSMESATSISSTCRHTDGWGVTTVTSQPSRTRCLATLRGRVLPTASGGKKNARNNSFGRSATSYLFLFPHSAPRPEKLGDCLHDVKLLVVGEL